MAVTVPDPLDVRVKLVIVNTPVVDPADTSAIRGTATLGSELLSAMPVAPLAGAESVTVQVELAFDARVVGLHCSDVITVMADRLTATL